MADRSQSPIKVGIFMEFFLPYLGGIERYQDRLSEQLRALGYDIPDSQSNFYLIRGDFYGLVEACARVGLIVRPFRVGVRVSVGSREQNDRFLSVAAEFARTAGIGA